MKILIVEDNSEINYMIQEYMKSKDIECYGAFSSSEAKFILSDKADELDAIILDIMLPYENGDTFLEELRKNNNIPVIVLSAIDDVEMKVKMLEIGANDYLTKPFDLDELYARLKVQQRKKSVKKDVKQGDLVMLKNERRVKLGEKEVKLTKNEYKILEVLMDDPDHVYTKSEIYELVWEQPFQEDDKVVNTHISNLRKKLQTISDVDYVETIWGIGFKLRRTNGNSTKNF